jgi:NAD(P)-dependent dehydrogenase (short-subunit alcohol dehydrogenase family)
LKQLDGKVAIVTGGAMGIGRSSVIRLSQAGAKVVFADINEAQANETLNMVSAVNGEAHFVYTDVTNPAEIKNIVDTAIERYGKIDILHNNAGVALGGNVVETTDDIWNKVVEVNLTSVFRFCKLIIPHMIQNGGGSIINTSSVQGIRGFDGWAAYAASKGGILALTRQIAGEYAKYQIRVNSVAPGTIDTPMNTKVFDEVDDPQALIDMWNSMHPIGRFGQADEIAETVLFLASDASSFITGQCIVADGGMSIKAEK